VGAANGESLAELVITDCAIAYIVAATAREYTESNDSELTVGLPLVE
jgi:hypothetical protein